MKPGKAAYRCWHCRTWREIETPLGLTPEQRLDRAHVALNLHLYVRHPVGAS